MRKFGILTFLFSFCFLPVFADESLPSQSTNDNRAVIAVQKQPASEAQKQEITGNKWCIIIQINGKTKEAQNEMAD